MTDNSPTIVYVCDNPRLHHLLAGIASWRRFAELPVCVVDIGLTDAGRRAVAAVANGGVTFLAPADTPPVPERLPAKHRAFAFAQKTLVGCHSPGDPVIFLDSDILVVHPGFLDGLTGVRLGELLAVPSAWDSDFNWTYSPQSLPGLRTATGDPGLTLGHPVCNSGVWAMRRIDAATIAPRWHASFRAALDSSELRATLRPGTEVGDQEFLVSACKAAGVAWNRLHGSFNMQVHERRMPWSAGPGGHPLGGHLGEPAEPLRAIHYGCEPDGSVNLDDGMITTPVIRDWVRGQYRACWESVRQKLGGRTPNPQEVS